MTLPESSSSLSSSIEPLSTGNLPSSGKMAADRPLVQFKPGDIAWVHTKNIRILNVGIFRAVPPEAVELNLLLFQGNVPRKPPRTSRGGGPHPAIIIRPYSDDSFMCVIGSHKLKPNVYKKLCAANNYMRLNVEKFQPNTMISLGTPVIAHTEDLEPTDTLKYPESPTSVDAEDFKILLSDLERFSK